MSRALRYNIPGVDWRRSHAQVAGPGIAAAFAPELPPPLSLVVEIGFCRGEFMMEMARRHPKRAFLGVEISFKRVLKMARRLAQTELENVRLLEADAEGVVASLLGDATVEEFWINFPDPSTRWNLGVGALLPQRFGTHALAHSASKGPPPSLATNRGRI